MTARLDGAVGADLIGINFDQRDHGPPGSGLDIDHGLKQFIALIDQVIAEQHGKGLVPNMKLGPQHRMPETLGIPLTEVVNVSELRGATHGGELLEITLCLKGLLDERHPVEVVLE